MNEIELFLFISSVWMFERVDCIISDVKKKYLKEFINLIKSNF